MNRGIDKLYQEKNNVAAIQDSSEMSDRRMCDKGSNQLLTSDERAKKKLIKNDHDIQRHKQSSKSATKIAAHNSLNISISSQSIVIMNSS